MKCPTCPHLDASRMPEGWAPRARCCVDDMPGHRALEERMAEAKAAGAGLPRQQRRAAERAANKVLGRGRP